ncbi:MAG: sialate O-acetylesterase [Planctomycetia bacterium]|nr:sialate O-acetylesterase [Planctomycetia bacterium]
MHSRFPALLRALAAVAVAASPALAEVRLPKIFTDGMMLQRDMPIRVWGWADPGENVRVSVADREAATKADDLGRWIVELPAIATGEGLRLSVAGRNTIVLENVIVGDIWLCSGQSNMEWSLSVSDAEADIKAADFPKIRRIKFGHTTAAGGLEDAPAATPWQVCTPQTAPAFTAVGFFFAREVHGRTGVPIGLLDDNWGGTPIERWTAPEGLESVPELSKEAAARRKVEEDLRRSLSQYIADLERWLPLGRRNLAADGPLTLPPPLPTQPGEAGWCAIYHAMVQPLVRLPIKGTLWYQGEANGSEGETYFHKMRALVGGWRTAFNRPDMPFYYVQLASYQAPTDKPAGGDGWAKIREAQRHALSIPRVGMAVAIDTVPLAVAGDIHPKNKSDIGLRLARWALHDDYGMSDVVPSGPLFKCLRIEGGKAVLEFDHVGSGLMVGSKLGREPAVEDEKGKLERFAIAGADKRWCWAEASIVGGTVVVSSPEVETPVAVRYAYSMNPHGANLYNREGLPASPFRTDDW